MKLTTIFTIIISICAFSACTSKSEKQKEEKSSSSSSSNDNTNESQSINYESSSSESSGEQETEENTSNSTGCKFEDGSYSATVDYNNSETGYSATYTLDVEVQDCQIVQINFPNDGYLDEDHISYADIDEDGNASVDGEDGKTYEIQIDN